MKTIALVSALALVAGCSAPTSAQSIAPSDTSARSTLATTALAALPVKGRAPMTGFNHRAPFGTPWADTDGNHCDQRNDVLRRDLAKITPLIGCTVNTGVLHDPYTGRDITFVRGVGTSSAVQVDHVVALGDAWQTGAQQLPPTGPGSRLAFATDMLNLLAVDGPTNVRKGDADAASWLPRAVFRCSYVARQIAVKRRYGLWVTVAERGAMAGVLATCPGQRLPQ